jgi:carbon catabolite-derepressing protein kinase
MDLQLYRVDPENFLVDFKNIGYYHANEREMQIPEAGSAAGLSSSQSQKRGESIGGVSGPFHFLEMACQLIHELAG